MEDNVYSSAIESLISGTEFNLSSKSSVLNQRPKIPTPVEAFNCILGGGIPFGTVFQSYGPPKAGKSTWLYQTMGTFQKKYPNGVSVVIDSEASADGSRLEFLGVDTGKVLRLPATSIESGFLNLMKMLSNKASNKELKDVPIFVIWDSISNGLAQDSSTQSRVNAMDRARVIKNYLSTVMTQIEKQDFVLGLLNQVIYSTDRYGNQHMDAGGGIALKHDVHFSVRVELTGQDTIENGFLLYRKSKMTIDKSKIGPEVQGIPVVIDATVGGSIDEKISFAEYMTDLGFISYDRGWYSFQPTVDYCNSENLSIVKVFIDFNKKYRYNDIMGQVKKSSALYDALRYVFMYYYGKKYQLQNRIIQPYMQDCYNKLLSEYDFAEIYMVNSEEEFNKWKDNLTESNKFDEVIGKIKDLLSSDNTKYICLDCGSVVNNYGYCDKCWSSRVVSKDVASKVLSKLDEVPGSKDNKEEESTSE